MSESRAQPRVLLLDAHLRHSIAVARSLGRRGIEVIAASDQRRFPASYSRYVARTVRLAAKDDLQALLDVIARERIGVLIAGGLPGNELICRYSAELESVVRAPFNDFSQFERLSNKFATAELAQTLGVPCPRTAQIKDPDEAVEIGEQLGFPVVFKSPVDQGTVRYASNPRELEQLAHEFTREQPALLARGLFPIAQQYIDGGAHGFYALAEHGEIRAYFMHRRLHEVPPSGGPSAMAMSYRDPELRELGERFFAATGWNGVAMVEFKRSRPDGRYYLLEVNPKFWGSLDLAIAAGVDFPYLLYCMLTGERLESELGGYCAQTIFRWLTMDLAYAVATGNVRRWIRSFADDRIADDFDASDPLPSLALFAAGFRRARKENVLAPNPVAVSNNADGSITDV